MYMEKKIRRSSLVLLHEKKDMHATSESNLYHDAQFIEEYRISGCRRRTSILYTMYFFAISATRSMIHRTYSKEDKQPVDTHGDQRNLSTDELLWEVCVHWMHRIKLPSLFSQHLSSHQEISPPEPYLHKAIRKMQDSL